jgi:uncharacterized protein (DUF2342 family)
VCECLHPAMRDDMLNVIHKTTDGEGLSGVTVFAEVDLSGGGSLIAEPRDEISSVIRASRLRDVTSMASETLESALERLRSAAEAVNAKMQGLATVQFTVKLGAAVGVVIANSTAEANLTVTLPWECNTDC